MKFFFTLIFLLGYFVKSDAQTGNVFHQGKFKKGKVFMSSNSYKPDNWEKPYFDSAIKTAFPTNLNKFPEKCTGKLIHLIGIVDSVYIDTENNNMITFILENKYWDYIEDYSIQDEVMFVSPKGEGKFLVTVTGVNPDVFESVKNFATDKKLFLVYGDFKELINNLPVITAKQIKYINYELYTTNVFSYEVVRDKNGEVQKDKKGKAQMTNFKFFKIAKAGQKNDKPVNTDEYIRFSKKEIQKFLEQFVKQISNFIQLKV